jgi:hypothetical protein
MKTILSIGLGLVAACANAQGLKKDLVIPTTSALVCGRGMTPNAAASDLNLKLADPTQVQIPANGVTLKINGPFAVSAPTTTSNGSGQYAVVYEQDIGPDGNQYTISAPRGSGISGPPGSGDERIPTFFPFTLCVTVRGTGSRGISRNPNLGVSSALVCGEGVTWEAAITNINLKLADPEKVQVAAGGVTLTIPAPFAVSAAVALGDGPFPPPTVKPVTEVVYPAAICATVSSVRGSLAP